ncbi:hypothetical protein F5Y19DRAFT_422503 [Xylariaceae sp. FL1651]|nr:hypothetical protein F5Y19DRAFT_422503 [Xylariaceae sp. FL1651]
MAQQAILNGPALAPPPGVRPNFDHPPNQNNLALAVTTICLSVSTTAFVLAAYAKLCCVKKVHFEDFIVLAGYGLIIGVGYCIYEVVSGVGAFVHQWNVRVRDLAHIFYFVHVGSILYSVAIMLLKVAILFQWIRIFVPRGTKGLFYWASLTLLVINVLLYSIIVITICASCKPFSRLWDKIVPGTCSANREIIDVATAASNLVSDFVILLLPQGVIWKLHVKRQKKIGITFIFLVGIFAIISAGFRVDASLRFFWSKDRTYQIATVSFWAIAELTCAILVFCVPSIPKIFRDSRSFIKIPTSLITWFKPAAKRIESSSRSTWPRVDTERLPINSLYEQSNYNHMEMRQYDLANGQS